MSAFPLNLMEGGYHVYRGGALAHRGRKGSQQHSNGDASALGIVTPFSLILVDGETPGIPHVLCYAISPSLAKDVMQGLQ